jgi:enamine deaminase RidA (YjgF/YER057c/UK114 family)/uncharacterized cupin superfamily protein
MSIALAQRMTLRCLQRRRNACTILARGIQYIRAVDGVPPPGAFSRATIHDNMVHVSGTGGVASGMAESAVAALSAYDETTRALDHIAAILTEAGSAPHRIVSTTMLLTHKEDYAECNRAYVSWFAEHGGQELPARSTALWAVPTTAKVAFSVVAAKRHPAFGTKSSQGGRLQAAVAAGTASVATPVDFASMPLEPQGVHKLADPGSTPMVSAKLFPSGNTGGAGVWECTPGTWHITRTTTETFLVLSGRATITNSDGSLRVELAPGVWHTTPSGWSGKWEVTSTLRKMYVLTP